MEQKTYAFQYAYGTYSMVFPEDTGLITRDEAEGLWNKYLPDFIKRLDEGQRPEMCVWKDMKNESDYHTELAHARWQDLETDGNRAWEEKREYLKGFSSQDGDTNANEQE